MCVNIFYVYKYIFLILSQKRICMKEIDFETFDKNAAKALLRTLTEELTEEHKENYIVQMIRLNGFFEDGGIDFSVDVPLNEYNFDSFEEAHDFAVKNNGTCKVYPRFWGEEYDYADDVEIYCGYVIYEITNDYKRIVGTGFCNPEILCKLKKIYAKDGQIGMHEWGRKNL